MDVFRAHRAVIHSISPQSLHTEYVLSSSEKRPHSRWTENVPGNLKKREERRGEVRRGEERRGEEYLKSHQQKVKRWKISFGQQKWGLTSG
jgi:hypothetical protein